MSDWYHGQSPRYAAPDAGPWTYYGPPDPPPEPRCPDCDSTDLDMHGDDYDGYWECRDCGNKHEWTT